MTTPRRSTKQAAWALLACLLLAAGASAQHDDLFDRAKSLRKTGHPGAAAALLLEALGQAGSDEKLSGLCGLCLLDDGRVPEAQSIAGKYSRYAGREPRLHTLLGRLAQAAGRTEEAAGSYRAAVAADPGFVEASVCLIRLALSAGQLGVAVAEAERLEAFQPELGRSLGAEALVAQAQKIRRAGNEQLGRAIEKYQAALTKRPGDLAIARPLLDCLLVSIRIEAARSLAASVFAEAKDAAERHYYEGRCCDATEDADRARAAYEAAVAADPLHQPALLELARLAIEDERWEEARALLAAAAGAGPVSARFSLLLGLAEGGLGHDAEAEAALRDALRSDAGNAKALYQLGRLLVRTGRDAEGKGLLAQVNTGPQ